MSERQKGDGTGQEELNERIAATLADEERRRNCHNCVFCTSDAGLWLRTLASGFPVVGLCANHPETPGQVRPIPSEPCRNFRARPQPTVRTEPPEPPNEKIRYIPLTRGLYAIVDAKNYAWLSRYKWYAHQSERGNVFYACRSHRGRAISMHREIMRPPRGMVVDHINGNGLDNREDNMRNCTQLQNSQNNRRAGGKSKFKGVFPRGVKWQAAIQHNGKALYLGLFDDEIEAAKARDRKTYELAGEFAYLNFPGEIEGR